jgi:hypothetical protein
MRGLVQAKAQHKDHSGLSSATVVTRHCNVLRYVFFPWFARYDQVVCPVKSTHRIGKQLGSTQQAWRAHLGRAR